jgi:ribosomal protein S18 acetylase RimI-like enzyme
MPAVIRSESDPDVRRKLLEAITAALPQWFGIPESNMHYAEQARLLPGLVASVGSLDVGLLLLKRHGKASAEIYWIGVAPGHHRHGAGRALVDEACRILAAEGRKLLFAHSLRPDHPNEHYRRTRRFYEGMGFVLAVTGHADPDDPMAWYAKLLTG